MTKQNPAGAPVPGAWGKEQKKGMEKQEQHSHKQQAQNNPSAQQGGQQQGDNRTPDEPIGEVAYANRDPAKKKTGEF